MSALAVLAVVPASSAHGAASALGVSAAKSAPAVTGSAPRTVIGPGKPRHLPPHDNSGGQPACFTDSATCSSFNPDVSFGAYSNGDTTGCTFEAIIDWGDGTITDQAFDGGPNGSQDATFANTYHADGSYAINWKFNDTDGSGKCYSNSGTLDYTLLSPPTNGEQGGPQNPSEKQTNCSSSDPVNCATGVFFHTFTDFSVPGRGVPLGLTRTYSSSGAGTDGPFGHGWTDSYDMSLTTEANRDVVVTQEDGSTVTFTPDGSGGFTAPPRVLATLTEPTTGSYLFTRHDSHISYGFSSGRLVSETDLNGYITTLSYLAGGRLGTVTDPSGRKLTFTYAGSRVATATDPMGRAWSYAYDAAGDLTSATDPLGRVWAFSYDGAHHLLTTTDPRGGVTTSTYNGSGQVTTQVDPDGGKTTWSYSGNPDTLAGGSTTMVDPDGHKTVYQYSELEMVSETAGAGTAAAATTSYTYDPATLGIATETNPDGNTTTNTYDANGNLLTSTDPLGNTTTYTYNSLNEVLSKVDPIGNATSYGYDADGNLLSMTDEAGDTTTYAYAGAAGDRTSVTNPDGHVTDYTYDSDGDVATTVMFPSASVKETTDYAYDKDGERTCVLRPVGVQASLHCPAAGAAAVAGTTATAYNADGETTSVTTPDGDVTSYRYDGDGNTAAVTNPAGQVTSYAYDGDNVQSKITEANGRSQVSSHDADGNLTKRNNTGGQVTAYTYDALGRVTSVTDPLGHVTKYGYDAAGHRTTVTDAKGQVTTYAYDADGRLTGISYSDGSTPTVTYTYDRDGHRTSMIDGSGTTSYSYDGENRLTNATNGAGARVAYTYDPAGQITTVTYPNGDAVTRTYDGAGELATVTDWLGNKTAFGYDHDGNLTAETYPNGVTASYAYDKDDQALSATDKKGATSLASFRYTRSSLGAITAEADTGTGGPESYRYTAINQLASDSAGKFGYDAAGDLTGQPHGVTQAYNADQQLTSTTSGGVTTGYAYNADGDLTKTGSVSLGYNQANELTSYGANATYAYDGNGLRMSKTVGGTTTDFAWDQSGSTPLVIAAGTTYYVYGPSGQPIEQITGTSPSYLQGDQAGSTRLITSTAGAIAGTYWYGPFGTVKKHAGTATTALQYDGQYTDGESGYQYLQARYYNPATGQFLTLDPMVAVTGEPYSYAAANPLNAADPTGQWCFSLPSWALPAALGIAAVGLTVLNVAQLGLDPVTDGLEGADIAALTATTGEDAALTTAEEGTTTLFRNVDAAEFNSIADTGQFSTAEGQMEGKWFASTGEDAEQWGQMLNNGEGLTVQTNVPNSVADQLFSVDKLDGIGPASYADGEQLQLINQTMDGIRLWP